MRARLAWLGSLIVLCGAGPARPLVDEDADPELRPVRRAVERAVRTRSTAPVRELIDRAARVKLERGIRDVRQLERRAGGDVDALRLHAQAFAALADYVAGLYTAALAPVGQSDTADRARHDRLCICDCPDCRGDDCAPCTCVCTGFDEACPWNEDSTTRLRR